MARIFRRRRGSWRWPWPGARGEPITIRGDGSATKDYIFVNDFADACVRLICKRDLSGPFNIGCNQGTRLLDVISSIENTVGRKAELIFEPAQTGDVSANVLDIAKIHQATGWLPATELNTGLEMTWEWMKPRIFRREGESGFGFAKR